MRGGLRASRTRALSKAPERSTGQRRHLLAAWFARDTSAQMHVERLQGRPAVLRRPTRKGGRRSAQRASTAKRRRLAADPQGPSPQPQLSLRPSRTSHSPLRASLRDPLHLRSCPALSSAYVSRALWALAGPAGLPHDRL